ncbi:DUF2207 domain-containing protein [Youngiibacter multivorans]|uniref:Membrane protein n=1 Tax=Youngiibacter multivorans TaxID=937251 RepID=A0ABS4G5G8_9CLOT|nr:DUF2207 domain-containing protein [Youngiibacter multivorans]MBP1919810.1 putative membrane protein [Youngiibacter multivorans]
MYKRSVRKTIWMAVLLILFLMPVFNADASSGTYDITSFDVLVEIAENGDAKVTEAIEYSFSGSFNGVLRDIDFSRTSGISDVTVRVSHNGSERTFTVANTGAANTYEAATEGNLMKLKVYEKSGSDTKTFIYGYTLKNVVEKYNDIATFNRKIIDANWKVPLENVRITIRIPEGAAKEDLKVFAHGPLTGTSSIKDGSTFEFTVPLVQGTFVETLAIFPPELVPGSTNTFNRDELPAILTNEQKLADDANKLREEAIKKLERETFMKNLKGTLDPIFILAAIFGLAATAYGNLKFSKEVKPQFEGDYYRELPGDYSPAVMSYLMTKGGTKPEDIMATLLDLARKKVVSLNLVSTTEKGLIFKTTDEVYRLEWRNREKLDELRPHEAFLAEWFIDRIGGGEGLDIDDLEKMTKKKTFARQFAKDYDKFKAYAIDEGEAQGFYTGNKTNGIGTFIAIGFGLLIIGGLATFLLGPGFGIAAGISGLLLITSMGIQSVRKKLTPYGAEQKAMWEAFKKFLLDFSNLEKADIPAITIWEHYLVYAVSLGVAKEVIDQLPRVFSDRDLSDPNLTYMRGYGSYNSMYMMNHMVSDTVRSVASAVNTANIASSAMSSGSGGGGGFSGGSSGGGGGGGGGGAF